MNKQIDNIDYNYLNLPQHISMIPDANNAIDYLYSANGMKLQKSKTINGDQGDLTHYLGSIVYTNETPDYIFTPEGRATPNQNGGYDYEYYLTDHLGNTRVSFNQSGEVLQDNSYYPFGMSMGESLTFISNISTENKYKYNGKELQDDLGLGWYDYGARFYDAALGRWHVPDPLSEWHFNNSPYNYCYNNPINFIDPFGLDTIPVNSTKPVKKGDVVVVEDGSYLNADTDEVEYIEYTYNWAKNKSSNMFTVQWDVGVNNDSKKGDGSSSDITPLMSYSGVVQSKMLHYLTSLRDAVSTYLKLYELSPWDSKEPTSDKEIIQDNTNTDKETLDSIAKEKYQNEEIRIYYWEKFKDGHGWSEGVLGRVKRKDSLKTVESRQQRDESFTVIKK